MKAKQIDIIAGWLARHYSDNLFRNKACACTGLSRCCIDCAVWWHMFLEKYSASDFETMYNLYNWAKEIR